MSESRLRVGGLCAGCGGLTMLGNGVVPPQAAYALDDMLACAPERSAA